jgi:ppGpp synthetase/RelA/SpoT-type nucleotidyltranferase
VSTRTKQVDSLVAKAVTVDGDDFKYADPREEIHDMVGARVMVPLSTDVPPVARVLNAAFLVDDILERGWEEEHDVPGYRSLHLLVRLREEDRDRPPFADLDDVAVEVQVRTILQHAWASLQHDLMYKSERPPSAQIRRRLIALAGLLELADQEFVRVRQTQDDESPLELAPELHRSVRLTVDTVRAFFEVALGERDATPPAWYASLLQVCTRLGLRSVEQLREALGEWSDRGPEVARVARVSKPWANPAYVGDLLLRLALDETYLTRGQKVVSDEARAAFAAEVADLRVELEVHP